MAPSILKTKIDTGYAFTTRKSIMVNYSVTVEDFDGETYDFEVTAESYEQAAREAEQLAAEQGCYNILNMFIYII